MTLLVLESYLLLVRIEILTYFRDLHSLHDLVRRRRVRSAGTRFSPERLCHAMNVACVFYPKRVMCLHYSTAATLLLRRHGVEAQMVIGAQLLPFKSHAWVEVDGGVVGDKAYMREIYQPLERC